MTSLEGWSSTIELRPRRTLRLARANAGWLTRAPSDRPGGRGGVGEAVSGRRDLNPRPPAPKAGALTKLRYSPSFSRV